jgi:hypothetical protein
VRYLQHQPPYAFFKTAESGKRNSRTRNSVKSWRPKRWKNGSGANQPAGAREDNLSKGQQAEAKKRLGFQESCSRAQGALSG